MLCVLVVVVVTSRLAGAGLVVELVAMTAVVLVAAGLIGHTVWDVVHWRRHEVVSRSLAEWCAALDLTLGAGVLGIRTWADSDNVVLSYGVRGSRGRAD